MNCHWCRGIPKDEVFYRLIFSTYQIRAPAIDKYAILPRFGGYLKICHTWFNEILLQHHGIAVEWKPQVNIDSEMDLWPSFRPSALNYSIDERGLTAFTYETIGGWVSVQRQSTICRQALGMEMFRELIYTRHKLIHSWNFSDLIDDMKNNITSIKSFES